MQGSSETGNPKSIVDEMALAVSCAEGKHDWRERREGAPMGSFERPIRECAVCGFEDGWSKRWRDAYAAHTHHNHP